MASTCTSVAHCTRVLLFLWCPAPDYWSFHAICCCYVSDYKLLLSISRHFAKNFVYLLFLQTAMQHWLSGHAMHISIMKGPFPWRSVQCIARSPSPRIFTRSKRFETFDKRITLHVHSIQASIGGRNLCHKGFLRVYSLKQMRGQGHVKDKKVGNERDIFSKPRCENLALPHCRLSSTDKLNN